MTMQHSQARNHNKINLEHTINSGQVFLWDKLGDSWWGIDGDCILKVSQDPPHTVRSFQSVGNSYRNSGMTSDILFRDDDGIAKVYDSLSRKDEILKGAIREFSGLRILRQDPFQCMVSFIVSSNSNIRRIRKNLYSLCVKFGSETAVDEKTYFVFPGPAEIAGATLQELAGCGLGYRARYVKEAAKFVADKKVDLEDLKKADYNTAKEQIMRISGIGDKVADCILLFSLEKLDAFPIDRWMIHVLKKYYSDVIDTGAIKNTLTPKQYERLHQNIADYFGKYCGYAQQFLFKMERELNGKSWVSGI